MVEPKVPLKHAPPPLHSVAIIALILAACIYALPSVASIDAVATVDTFITPVFPEGFVSSPEILGWTRMFFSFAILCITLEAVFGKGWEQTTTLLPQSKLRSRTIKFTGLKTQAFFTSWSWNLLGFAFFLNGLIPLLVTHGREDLLLRYPWIQRIALLSFETSAPTAMLVAFVVTYAIWPKLLADGKSTDNLRSFPKLMQHNANVIMVLIEVSLLGGLPVRSSDFAVAPLFGIAYVLYTWFMINRWAPNDGPHFIYFFFDTTLGKTTSIVLLILLVVLTLFYALFSIADHILGHFGGGVISHSFGIAMTAAMVCRFRD